MNEPEVYGVTAKGNGDAFLAEERHTSLSVGGGNRGKVTRVYSFVNRRQWGDKTELAETIRSNCHGDYPCVAIEIRRTTDERT